MTGHPFDDLFAALVQRLQLHVLPPVEATVVSQGADGRLDLEIDEALGLGKGPQGVDFALQGVAAVKIAPGSRVLLEFLAAPAGDSEPRRPIVRSIISGTILEATITAQQRLVLDGTAQVDLSAATVNVGPTAGSVNLGAAKALVATQGAPVQVAVPAGTGTVTGAIQTQVKA